MKKTKIIIPLTLTLTLTLYSSLSFADFIAFINNDKYSIGITPITCSENEGVTREELMSMIENNEDLENICTSNITNFSYLFYNIITKQDIRKWDVSNGTNFNYMFYKSNFNMNISKWNVSKATSWSAFNYKSALKEENIPPKFRQEKPL